MLKKKIKREYKRAEAYFKSHFSSFFILTFLIFSVIFICFLMGFMRSEFYDYLSKTSRETEITVCNSLASALNAKLQDSIEQGSQLASDTGIGERLKRAAAGELGASTELYNYLSKKDYPSQIVAVAIVGPEGLVQQYDLFRTPARNLWSDTNMDTLEAMYDEVMASRDSAEKSVSSYPRAKVFTKPYAHPLRGGKQVFHVAYPFLGDGSGITNYSDVLVVTYALDEIRNSLGSIEIQEVNLAEGYVVDADNTVVAKAGLVDGEEKLDLEERTGNISYLSQDLDYFGWKLVLRLDETVLRRHVNAIYHRGLYFYLLIIGFFMFCCLSGFRIFLQRPVQIIREAIQSVKEGKRDSIKIGGTNELWQLAEEYNSMVEQLEVQRIHVEEQHQKTMEYQARSYEAEREALESQINAHFICNTLGAISYDASDAGDEKTAILIKKLSNILRYSFDRKLQEVFLSQEISWIEQYLYLQKERYEDVFDYQVEYDERYGDWPCCKLMLQPFVENSILHGFEGRNEGGLLRIEAGENGGKLHIVIADNGCGMPEETANVIRQILKEKGNVSTIQRGKVGVGILNVIIRMKMFYGAAFDAEMTTAPQEGTSFSFCLPLPAADWDEEEENEDIDCGR